MIKRALLAFLGAALFASAAPVASAARRPAAAQSSSSNSSGKSSPTSAPRKKRTSAKSRGKSRSRTRAQMSPTPDRIREIQAALQKDGFYEGEPTGKWDAATVDALRKFQDKNGFPSTGKIDALSLNKLGLGSETAGRGAPLPATTPPSSNAGSSPSSSAGSSGASSADLPPAPPPPSASAAPSSSDPVAH